MKANFILVYGLALLAGCASGPQVAQSPQAEKLSVTQVGRQESAEFVLCDAPHCPKRTLKTVAVPPEAPKPVSLPAVAKPVEPLRLKVHFKFGRHDLDKAGRQELQAVLAAIKNNPTKAIRILGRTDPVGPLKFNQKLALRRANAVRDALIKSGVEEGKAIAVSHEPCCDGDPASPKSKHHELRRSDVVITLEMKH